MKITRNVERRDKFLLDIALKTEQRRMSRNEEPPFHVSDLLHPLVTYWARAVPRPMGDSAPLFFAIGNSIHAEFEPYFAKDDESMEVPVMFENIVGTVDAIDDDDVNVELKGTRKRAVKPKPEDAYVEQVQAYCALSRRTRGRIVTVYMSPEGYVPEVTVDDIEFEEHELEITRKQLVMYKGALEAALEKRDPSALPECPVRMCTYCKWNDICKGSRRLKRM